MKKNAKKERRTNRAVATGAIANSDVSNWKELEDQKKKK